MNSDTFRKKLAEMGAAWTREWPGPFQLCADLCAVAALINGQGARLPRVEDPAGWGLRSIKEPLQVVAPIGGKVFRQEGLRDEGLWLSERFNGVAVVLAGFAEEFVGTPEGQDRDRVVAGQFEVWWMQLGRSLYREVRRMGTEDLANVPMQVRESVQALQEEMARPVYQMGGATGSPDAFRVPGGPAAPSQAPTPTGKPGGSPGVVDSLKTGAEVGASVGIVTKNPWLGLGAGALAAGAKYLGLLPDGSQQFQNPDGSTVTIGGGKELPSEAPNLGKTIGPVPPVPK